jgi:hypothetical protein
MFQNRDILKDQLPKTNCIQGGIFPQGFPQIVPWVRGATIRLPPRFADFRGISTLDLLVEIKLRIFLLSAQFVQTRSRRSQV